MNLRQDIRQALVSVVPSGPHAWEACFRFDSDMPIFQGHFPGHPIVPGVYLLEAAACAFQRGSGQDAACVRVKSAKFMTLVEPPCDVVARVRAQEKDGGWSIQAEISRGGVLSATASLEMK